MLFMSALAVNSDPFTIVTTGGPLSPVIPDVLDPDALTHDIGIAEINSLSKSDWPGFIIILTLGPTLTGFAGNNQKAH